jgi:hypothetical protein
MFKISKVDIIRLVSLFGFGLICVFMTNMLGEVSDSISILMGLVGVFYSVLILRADYFEK